MPVAISATFAANETLDHRRRSGLPVLPLAFGEAGLPVLPSLERRLGTAAGCGAYGPVAGSTDLRTAAAGYWHRRGLPADPGLIVAGPGSKPLLYGLLLAIGGGVVVPRPSWVSYAAQTRLMGAEPIFVATPPGEGGVPDPDALRAAVTLERAAGRAVSCLVVTLPDNPTGTLARPETVRRMCEVARELDLIIIADQIYRDLIFDQNTDFPCPTRYAPERTVITTALSKNLAVGGWRIGVALLPEALSGLRDRLAGVASDIWSSASSPTQQAAAYAFAEPPEVVERVAASRRLHETVARAMAERFTAVGARVPRPQGGFYLYPDFEDLRERLGVDTSAELSALLLDRYGVGVLPGSAFGDAPEALRLRVATSLLYGETDEQRLTALTSPDPVGLPWIAAALDRATEVLTDLTSSCEERIAVTA
ncbi:pyridoxal phosphate-dependent aminotransferase [Actinoallomurus sp. NBC_01490]|uniref:pyridoxal phosphate-dependent aminotransferase n=1 Tax=Actinoallomurus sp. NBC_01490 TaxID=2903557 RepID=UPI002E315C53|nr:pyridoxal phosphate-dependent aminotransferase [Actinoallomurus sp. NBC_01490]